MTSAMAIRLDHTTFRDLARHGHQQAVVLDHPVLVSHTERIPTLDLLPLFKVAATTYDHAFFWQHPDDGFAIVGIGSACLIETDEPAPFGVIKARWRCLLDHAIIDGLDTMAGSGPTLLGGFAFDPGRPRSALWRGFAAGSLNLPRIMLTVSGHTASLTMNLLVAGTDDVDAVVDQIAQSWETIQAIPQTSSAAHAPRALIEHSQLPAAVWQAMIARTTAVMQDSNLEKVALARAVELATTTSFDVSTTLAVLRGGYPTATIFAVVRGDSYFVGATPERLAGMRAGMVRASGLAGTAARGGTPDEDALLGQQLLDSAKNRHEHAVVVDMLRATLGDVCADLHAPPVPRLLKLSNVQHLFTPVSGRIRSHYTLLDVVARLHPTPAVGGLPRAAALEHIRAEEQLDRGWYAGPVGWLDARGEGDFSVALRCGLLRGDTATLFAGCGIVPDSDPVAEYNETCLKLTPMHEALARSVL
ncbi:MAG: isochorismate synthase [Herpetosiphon sp.]